MSTMNESYQREKLNLQEVFPWTSVLIVLVPSAFELNEMRCTSERDATYKSSLRGSLCSFSSTADGPSSVNMACQRERLHLQETSRRQPMLIMLVLSSFDLRSTKRTNERSNHKMYISGLYLLDTACGMLDIEFAPRIWSVLESYRPVFLLESTRAKSEDRQR
jgi:hypothetical protein